MFFKELSTAFEEISKTRSRTRITELLAHIFAQATASEAQIITYFSLGSLRPPYRPTQFGLAEKSVASVIASVLETTVSDITKKRNKLGDLGLVVGQGIWSTRKKLTIEDIYEQLTQLEKISGTGSHEKKSSLLKKILLSVSPREAQTIVHIIMGRLRLGFSEGTIMDALSWMIAGDKSVRKEIESAYAVCADLGRIAALLKKEGVKGLQKIKIVVGIPLMPALAERLPTAQAIMKKMGPCVAEPKLDGFRLQVHIQRTKSSCHIWFYSRNLIETSAMFPDLVAAFKKTTATISSIILDGEALVYDEKNKTFLPFQETIKRHRTYGIQELSSTKPLHIFLFDIMYLNGKGLIDKPQQERYQLLLKLYSTDHTQIISVDDEASIKIARELETYFEKNINAGLEGVVVKRPDAPYQAGKRNYAWIKLKKGQKTKIEDTIDAVILGYYYGSGRRSQFGIGAILVGVYNDTRDRFETIAKVGSGLTDQGWRDLKKKCDEHAVAAHPNNVVVEKRLIPDVWVAPEIVCTVIADEITSSPSHTAGKVPGHPGYSLRIPRFIMYRPDKSPQEATTVNEIKKMWKDEHKRVVHAQKKAIKS